MFLLSGEHLHNSNKKPKQHGTPDNLEEIHMSIRPIQTKPTLHPILPSANDQTSFIPINNILHLRRSVPEHDMSNHVNVILRVQRNDTTSQTHLNSIINPSIRMLLNRYIHT